MSDVPIELSLWERILAYFEAGNRALRGLFEGRTSASADSVAFSIAFIALSAKLAKADGVVTRDEVRMFRRIFDIPPEEEANAARVYDLCRQETTGYEVYARQMTRALDRAENGDMLREHVLDGLFHIALADDEFHSKEDEFLERVAEIFGVEPRYYRSLKARHVQSERDPYTIVGVSPDIGLDDLKKVRNRFIRDNHPDILIAKGLPTEMIAIGHRRIADFNSAFDEIRADLEEAHGKAAIL